MQGKHTTCRNNEGPKDTLEQLAQTKTDQVPRENMAVNLGNT